MLIPIVGCHFGWVVYGWLSQYGGKLGWDPHWGAGYRLACGGRWARGPGAGVWALSIWWGRQGALHVVRRSSI